MGVFTYAYVSSCSPPPLVPTLDCWWHKCLDSMLYVAREESEPETHIIQIWCF